MQSSLVSHQLILGWSFLSNNGAVIEYRVGGLYLSDSLFDDTDECTLYRLAVTDNVVILTFSTVCVDVAAKLPCDAVHAIAEPNRDSPLQHGLALPHCLVDLSNSQSSVWVINVTQESRLFGKATNIALLTLIEGDSWDFYRLLCCN